MVIVLLARIDTVIILTALTFALHIFESHGESSSRICASAMQKVLIDCNGAMSARPTLTLELSFLAVIVELDLVSKSVDLRSMNKRS